MERALRAYMPVHLTAGIECALFRLDDPRVFLQVKIVDGSERELDEYRMPVIWFDGKVAIDLCLSKAMDELLRQSDPQHVSFSAESNAVSGVIWHGNSKDGTGVIGKLLDASSVTVRVYLDDYTIEDVSMEAGELASLKQAIRAQIL